MKLGPGANFAAVGSCHNVSAKNPAKALGLTVMQSMLPIIGQWPCLFRNYLSISFFKLIAGQVYEGLMVYGLYFSMSGRS
jgi:hypothetical protein